MKYLLPGVFFLAVFGIYPVLYTAYASTTNYGTGHVLSQGPGDRPDPEPVGERRSRVRRATTSTPLRGRRRRVRRLRAVRPRGRAALPRHARPSSPSSTSPTPCMVTHGRRGARSSSRSATTRACDPGDVRTLPGYPADPDAYVMPGETEDAAITISGGAGGREHARPAVYDAGDGTITDVATGIVYHEDERLLRRRRRHPAESRLQRPASASRTIREVLTDSEFRATVPARARVEPRVRRRCSVVDCVRARPAARGGVQRRAHEGPEGLPIADHHPVRPARVHDRAGVAGHAQRDVRGQPLAALRRRRGSRRPSGRCSR